MIPSALNHVQEIVRRVDRPAVFLDYDGTLTPIVSHPDKASLPDSMREALRALVKRMPVAILSGRDLDDVRQRVNIGAIVYAGSHGFDIAGLQGVQRQQATEFLPALDVAEKELREKLAATAGAFLERKRFSIAAHYRNANEGGASKVKQAVNEVAARHSELRKMEGKKVYELLPDIDWDKGKAVLWLLQSLGLELAKVRPIYIGDDRTDEDAFRALEQHGIGILVSAESRPTAATYSLKDPIEVERFLRELIEITKLD